MKKKFYLLPFVALLFSCSSETEQYGDLENQVVSDEMIKTRSLNTEDHALGFSYDATGEYLNRYSIKNSVIDVAKLCAYDKNSVVTSNEISGENQYYYGYSSYEYIKKVTEKNGVNVSASSDSIPNKNGSLSFSGTFSNSKENFDKYMLSTKCSYASADICKDVRWIRMAENVDVYCRVI